MRVLLVDDDADMRLIERFALAHDRRFVVVGEAGDAVLHKEDGATLDVIRGLAVAGVPTE